MKKTLALLLCFLMLASLASCKGGDDPAETTAATTTAATEDEGGSESNKGHTTILSNKQRARLAIEEVLANEKTLIYSGEENYIHSLLMFANITNENYYSYVNVDMDKDGIEEMIIQINEKYNTRKLLLHYEDDVVYGFSFDEYSMYEVHPDGSFRWFYFSSDGYEYGYSTLSFDQGSLKFTELCRNEKDARWYINSKEVTFEEYWNYVTARFANDLEFSPLEASKWGGGKAIQLAEKYWNVENGGFEAETGYRYKLTANIYGDKVEDRVFVVCLYKFIDNSYYQHIECVLINIDTGNISTEVDSADVHAKG